MWPLLRRDGQILQYGVVTLFWNAIIGYNPWTMPSSPLKLFSQVRDSSMITAIVAYSLKGAYGAMISLHILEVFIAPPDRYPDLYVVLNVALCTSIFGVCWLWGMKRQLEVGWSISSLEARPIPVSDQRRVINSRAKTE